MKKNRILIIMGVLILSFLLYRNFQSINPEIEEQKQLQKQENYEKSKNKYTVSDSDLENLKPIKKDVEILYERLLSFKNNEDFHIYGFGQKYKYNDWLKRIEKLSEDEMALKFNIHFGFSIGDLETLGQEYRVNKGKETKLTIWARKRIEKGLKSDAS